MQARKNRFCQFSRTAPAVMLFFLFVFFFAGTGNAAQDSDTVLVTQPAYVGMQFHVYRPMGIPANWYATFDGYPVWKNADGIWLYGSASGSSLIPTNYVVGSIVPSIVGLTPYVTAVSATPVQTAPPAAPAQAVSVQSVSVQTSPAQTQPLQVQTFQPVTVTARPAANQTVYAPSPILATAVVNLTPAAISTTPVMGTALAVTLPRWKLNPRFQVLGDWKGSVDRIGLLAKPAVPIAWKGRNPSVVYAWTGTQWYQMAASEGERAGDVLRNHLYSLTRLVHKNGNWDWVEPNISLLAHQAAEWGYRWMGTFNPLPSPSYSD